MSNICPIFNEDQGFIGCWALNKNFEPTLGTLSELMSLAEPTLRAFSMNPTRRVDNASVDVGNGVRFENGVFLMIKDELAPSEELARSEKSAFALIDHHGIPCLIRCARTDSRINAPPATKPPSCRASPPATSPASGNKQWWKFWK
jgi:hypothetical protein